MMTPINRRQSTLRLLLLGCIAGAISACSSESHDVDLPVGDRPVQSVTDEVYTVVDPDRLNVLQPATVNLESSLPYPDRSDFQIKSIQTDGWSNRQDFLDANTGGVALNFVWQTWEPTQKTSACNLDSEIRFEGHCFRLDSATEADVRYWSNKGVLITAVVWGVPQWARIKTGCNPAIADQKMFCAPENSSDFARFTGMLAQRYDGRRGNGRIADFVMHNEVNMNRWYNTGCGNGVVCERASWIDRYANDYNAAYDAIIARQPAAKVFTSFAHQFDVAENLINADSPVISVKSFLQSFNTLTAGRRWRVAYHPYPPHLLYSGFSPEDLPYVTYGNIGVLAGWLRAEFPLQPEAWEIHLTESGVNSVWLYSSEGEQSEAICDSFRNILATPGIKSHVYHRMVDHAVELKSGAGFGLHNVDLTPKEAWTLWSTMSGRKGHYDNLNCGFENIPYTKLTMYTSNNRHPWASTRIPPSGYEALASWKLMRGYEANTNMLYECGISDGTYISSDVSCGGAMTYGPVGYAYAAPVNNSVALFSCTQGSSAFVSTNDSCDGGGLVEFLGYAIR